MNLEREASKRHPQVYPLNEIRANIGHFLVLPGPVDIPRLPEVCESPSETGFDYGINLIKYSKDLGMNPQELSQTLIQRISPQNRQDFEKIESSGHFINFRLKMSKFGSAVTDQILKMGKDYGIEKIGPSLRVVVDLSSPNIAKRMSYGHLRSTIIGDSIANLYKSQGHEVIRDNHLGDWGTQFGKLIVAIKKWGNEKEILAASDPIGVLQDLYVKFHSEVDVEKEILRTQAKKQISESGYVAIPGLTEAVEAVK